MVPADYEGFFFLMQFQSEWWYTILRTHACTYILVEKRVVQLHGDCDWTNWSKKLLAMRHICSFIDTCIYVCLNIMMKDTSGGDMHRNKSLYICGIFASSFPFCFASSHHWRFSYSELFINYVTLDFQDNEEETRCVNTASHTEQRFWCDKLQSPCLCKSTCVMLQESIKKRN